MYIRSINIEKIGCFTKTELTFQPGVNILFGSNGSGKTTVLSVIYSMLQNREIFQCVPDSDEIPIISMRICNDNEDIKLEKRYAKGRPEIVFRHFEEIIKASKIDNKKVFLWNCEETFRGSDILSIKDIERAINFMKSLGMEEVEKYGNFFNESHKYYLMSAGQQMLLSLFSILSILPEGAVLLMDEILARLDIHMADRLLMQMQQMKNIQFIIAMCTAYRIQNLDEYNVQTLPPMHDQRKFYPSVNYRRYSKQSIMKQLSNVAESEDATQEKKIVRYQINRIIDEEERRDVEFKEIKGLNPCDTIIATAEIYIVAFLNSQTSQRGVIKWGISDDGRVVGVRLTREDRDTIRRKLFERIAQIQPYLSADLVHIEFSEIIDQDEELLPEQYVVEIYVKTVRSEELFATSKNEVYMKTESGKRKLTPHEVQLELKARLKR